MTVRDSTAHHLWRKNKQLFSVIQSNFLESQLKVYFLLNINLNEQISYFIKASPAVP